MTRAATLASLVCALLLAGCLGGTGPKEQLLRLDAAGDCPEHGGGTPVALIKVRQVRSLPGLERRALLIRQGDVLSPSVEVFFEGQPAELVERALTAQLLCAERLGLAWPRGPRSGADLLLGVDVTAFEYRRAEAGGSGAFAIQAGLTLWGAKGRTAVARTQVAAEHFVSGPGAQGVAEAADAALADVATQAVAWLETQAEQ